MVSCAVRGCKRRLSGDSDKTRKFYSFPKNSDLQKIWADFCDSEKTLNPKRARICSRHFEKRFYFKRPIDVALGLDCPVRFRNLSENAVPTLNSPPKEGEENQVLTEDENWTANMDFIEMNPESSGAASENSDSCGEVSRYFFSAETVPKMMDSATITDTQTVFEIVTQAEPLKKRKTQKTCRSRSTEDTKENTVTTETPYMEFYTDYSALNDKLPYCDDDIAPSNEVLDTSNASKYIILKRSVWKATEERLQRNFKRSKEFDEIEIKYAEALEEIQKLKGRLTHLSQDTAESVTSLKTRVYNLEERNSVLTNENSALKKDKEKLEGRFKKHALLLKQYFTTGQIKRMFCDDPQKRTRWTAEDIAQALSLKAVSIAAYKFLQDKLSFLLPDLSTLRRWMKNKKKILEDEISSNPTENDTAVQNMILLYEQTDGGVEILEADVDVKYIELLVEE